MKIAFFDDLHIEVVGRLEFELPDADVCVLAGDICVAALLQDHKRGSDSRRHRKNVLEFFTRLNQKYARTLYVMGNHEHYRYGNFYKTASIIRAFLEKHELTNIVLLDNEEYLYEGVAFFGATLWTDCNREDPLTLVALRDYLKDFAGAIKLSDDPNGLNFTPEFSVEEHKKSVALMKEFFERRKDMPIVVITHHAPCELSLDPTFVKEYHGNGAYYSRLEDLLFDFNVKVWFHGHVHKAVDYYVSDARVCCNPRGYPYEIHWNITGFNPRKVVEI